jgi:hypothetical protein
VEIENNVLPNPGSYEAAVAGCTCPVTGNNNGAEPPKGGWIMRASCSVHGFTPPSSGDRVEKLFHSGDDIRMVLDPPKGFLGRLWRRVWPQKPIRPRFTYTEPPVAEEGPGVTAGWGREVYDQESDEPVRAGDEPVELPEEDLELIDFLVQQEVVSQVTELIRPIVAGKLDGRSALAKALKEELERGLT